MLQKHAVYPYTLNRRAFLKYIEIKSKEWEKKEGRGEKTGERLYKAFIFKIKVLFMTLAGEYFGRNCV